MLEMRIDKGRPVIVKYLWVLVPMEKISKLSPACSKLLYHLEPT